MSAKAKGNYAERRVRDILIRQGYGVTKAGGSLGLFDLVAVDKNSVRFIQVKYGTARLSKTEREEIKAFQVPTNCTKEYWLLKKHAKPLITLL